MSTDELHSRQGEPLPFYSEFGFVESGEWERDEKVMVLTLEEKR